MVHSHGEIVINRPPAEVFDDVADTSKEPEYNPRSLSSATRMPSMDLHRTLTFDPDPEGTRMHWSWDLEPDGALRGLALPRQRSAWTTWSAMAGPFWVGLRTRRSCSDRSVGRGNGRGICRYSCHLTVQQCGPRRSSPFSCDQPRSGAIDP